MTDPEYNFYPLDLNTASATGNIVAGAGGTVMAGGAMQSPNFSTGSSGWIIRADGSVEFGSGKFRGDITGATGTFAGTVNVGAINIPDETTVNSFHIDASGNAWWGTNVATGYATSVAKILATGAATFKSATIGNWTVNTTSIYTGTEDHSGYTANAGDITIYSDGTDSSIHANQFYIGTDGVFHSTSGSLSGVSITAVPNDTNTDISLLEATHDLVFSVTDKDTVAWALGTITLSNGRTFSITAGNTGNMVARTYIYLDTGVSSTALQTTTTVSTAIGANKKLIAWAQNGNAQAIFTVYGGIGGLKLPASGTSISNNNWSFSGAWSVTDADTVAWGAGTLTTSDGGSYSISGSNTGNMATTTFVYFDLGTSSTAFQTTTTRATAVGDGKILIAICKNGTNEANFIVVNDNAYNIDASNISAGSITANELSAGSVTASKINVSQLSAITADLGSITAGSITINSGVASVDSSGNATFKSIQIGGSIRQYTFGDNGLYSFGDGSDGSHTTTGDETLTADKYYTDLTIATGHTINPNGYRIFCAGTLTLQGTGKIARNGVNGSNGSDGNSGAGVGGAGGTALASGYLKGSVAGGAGGDGGGAGAPVAGTAGGNTSNSIGVNGASGGTGGTGTAESGASGGSGGTATASNIKLTVGVQLAQLLDVSSTGATVKFDNSGAAGGGGGGGDDAGGNGGGGGGGAGSGGGIVAIYAKNIVVGASAAITANGGNGGNGGSTFNVGANTGGGGGGAGGTGGVIVLVYNTLSNSGTITASGGTGGTGGARGGGNGGTNGSNGSNGTTGRIYQFQLSI